MRPIPVTVGQVVGWYHPSPAPSGRTVLLLAAEGYEALCAHRPWRDLAGMLAEAGLPAMRFDYPGQGDSGGPEEEAPDLGAWTSAADLMAAELRRLSGASEVAVVGLRLGAAVAGLLARRLPSAPMALLFPVVSGRAHARELRVLTAPTGDGPEILGYPWSDAALAEVSRFDLVRSLREAEPRPVLLLPRPEAARAAETAAAALPDAMAESVAGYESLFAEAHAVAAPMPAFARIVAYLGQGKPDATATGSAPGDSTLHLPGGVTERPARFGTDDGLVGAWTEPPGGARAGTTALLIPNTGANHHSGNGRLSVLLARHVAATGVPVLRYDATGLGESENPTGIPIVRLVYQPGAVADSRQALDWLAETGHPQVVAVGVCAGAWTSLHAALSDPRIVHAVPVNLQRFLWREGRILTVPARRQSVNAANGLQWGALADAWRNRAAPLELLRAVLPPRAKLAWKRNVVRRQASLGRALPVAGRLGGPARVAAALGGLGARGGRVTMLYGSEDCGLDELESHFGDRGRHLSSMTGMEVAFLPDSDHTFSARHMRRRLIARMIALLRGEPG